MILTLLFIYMHQCGYLQRPEEGIRFPGTGVTGSCELLSVLGAGNQKGTLEEDEVLLTPEHLS